MDPGSQATPEGHRMVVLTMGGSSHPAENPFGNERIWVLTGD